MKIVMNQIIVWIHHCEIGVSPNGTVCHLALNGF